MNMNLVARAALAAVLSAAAGGCSTTTDLLRLQRDNLQTIRSSETTVREAASQMAYDPARYDLHLFLNSQMFNDLLQQFDGTTVPVGDRPIDVTLRTVRLRFRPGYPDISIDASARDRRSGATAELTFASVVTVEGDPNLPGALFLRIVPTKVVPNLKWGPLDLKKWRFARRLLELQATEFAGRIPRVQVPVNTAFRIGGPAGQRQVTLPSGDGSMTGQVTWPSTLAEGTVAVKHVLFLKNGVHIFADVGGL